MAKRGRRYTRQREKKFVPLIIVAGAVLVFGLLLYEAVRPKPGLAMPDLGNQHIVYPEKAKEKGISGTVFISFNIDVDGSVVDVKVVRKVHPLLDKEALRIIKKMDGKWIAGQQNKKPVKTNMVVPVKFSLN